MYITTIHFFNVNNLFCRRSIDYIGTSHNISLQGNAGMSPYSASKAGVIGLVKAAGKEYATSGKNIK